MKFRFFTVPALDPERSAEALNGFCSGHRIVAIERHFVVSGADSYWAFCVTYADGAEAGAGSAGSKRPRIDYKELLGDRDFAVYAELRALRKELAEREGVPAYALFTNEQLAEMVTRRVDSLTALGAVGGVGKSRVEKYGAAFLAALRGAAGESPIPDDEAAADRAG